MEGGGERRLKKEEMTGGKKRRGGGWKEEERNGGRRRGVGLYVGDSVMYQRVRMVTGWETVWLVVSRDGRVEWRSQQSAVSGVVNRVIQSVL